VTSELEFARAILAGEQVMTPRRIRIAAFLTRQALEAEIEMYCEQLVAPMPFPVRMRSRLAVLHALDQTGFSWTAEYAWIALSRACHHHSYELSPTISELRHLHSRVAGLAAMRASA
jgi:hypothetical protein